MTNTYALILFTVFILALLSLDLGLFNRRPHTPSLRETVLWSAAWLTLALLFNVGVFFWRGPEPALQFLTGYILELSLSMDNVFVFALIFSYMAVPPAHQHRVLFWGILGALVMRALFIGADWNAGPAVIGVDGICGGSRSVRLVFAVGDDGKQFAFAAVGQRVQQGQSAGVVAIAGHVRVENDLHRW